MEVHPELEEIFEKCSSECPGFNNCSALMLDDICNNWNNCASPCCHPCKYCSIWTGHGIRSNDVQQWIEKKMKSIKEGGHVKL